MKCVSEGPAAFGFRRPLLARLNASDTPRNKNESVIVAQPQLSTRTTDSNQNSHRTCAISKWQVEAVAPKRATLDCIHSGSVALQSTRDVVLRKVQPDQSMRTED